MLDSHSPSNHKPRARREAFVVERAGQELIVHDHVNGAFHTLNDVAAEVWAACDGTASVDEIASRAGHRVDVVDVAIVQLANAGLLEGRRGNGDRVDRRRVMKLAAAGLLVPVVTSISVPDASAVFSVEGGQGGNSGPLCFSASDCPGFRVGQTCTIVACTNGACVTSFASPGTPCGGLSQTCNGEGLCLL